MYCCAAALTTLVSDFSANGAVCTSTGILIVSDYGSHTLSAIHIATGAVEPIDLSATGKLPVPFGLALSDSERVVYVACNTGHQIKSVALPARYFAA